MEISEYLEVSGDPKELSLEMIAATLAHEIKNPLALIKANIDYIELCDTENKYRKNYVLMKKEIARVNELLSSFGKCLRNGFDMYEVVDLSVIMREIVEKYGQHSHLRIALDICGATRTRGSNELIHMALSNVMKNAAEAIESNGMGEIEILIRRTPDEIMITITDNGCGLGSDTISKLSKGIPVTTKKYGNGLGIGITKKIITLHGGSYAITNNSSGGVTVEIRLRAY